MYVKWLWEVFGDRPLHSVTWRSMLSKDAVLCWVAFSTCIYTSAQNGTEAQLLGMANQRRVEVGFAHKATVISPALMYVCRCISLFQALLHRLGGIEGVLFGSRPRFSFTSGTIVVSK